jgi:hypothetical protein
MDDTVGRALSLTHAERIYSTGKLTLNLFRRSGNVVKRVASEDPEHEEHHRLPNQLNLIGLTPRFHLQTAIRVPAISHMSNKWMANGVWSIDLQSGTHRK